MFEQIELATGLAFIIGSLSVLVGKHALLLIFPKAAPLLAASGKIQEQIVKLLDAINKENCDNDKIIETAKNLGLKELESILLSKTGLKVDLNKDGKIG